MQHSNREPMRRTRPRSADHHRTEPRRQKSARDRARTMRLLRALKMTENATLSTLP